MRSWSWSLLERWRVSRGTWFGNCVTKACESATSGPSHCGRIQAQLSKKRREARGVWQCSNKNAGQMIDDVRLSILGDAPVVSIGGISSDEAGFGIGPIFDTSIIRERIERGLGAEGNHS